MSAIALACTSTALTLAFVVAWQLMIRQVRIAGGRWLLNLLVGSAMLAAVLALLEGPGATAGSLAGLSLLVCGLFVVLSQLSGQSDQPPAVVVGQPLPEFSAPDENGERFDLASLKGRPLLLKFFRGHW